MSENESNAYTLKGTYYQSMDVKGRMTFPAKLREIIGEKFIVTRGSDGCLFVYSQEDFDRKNEQLKNLPMKASKDFQRFFTGGATVAEPDKQGRILIPAALRKWAELEKDVIVLGVNDRCEIWSKEKWEEFNENIDSDALLEALEGVGL